MKTSIYILFLLGFTFSFSQEERKQFNGEIHAIFKTVLHDEDAFQKDAESYLRISDSIVTNDFLNNPDSSRNSQYSNLEDRLSSNRIANMIALDYNTGNDWRRPKFNRWILSDTMIKVYEFNEKPFLLDRETGKYLNRYKYKPLSKERVLSEYSFHNSSYKNIIIDRKDKNIIAGVECFKIVVSYDDRKFIGFNQNYEIIHEMYVTEKIQSKYNPLENNLNILNTYFPMYVKSYATGLKGRYFEKQIVKLADESNANEKQLATLFKKTKDSLLSEYKLLIESQKAKERAAYFTKEEKRKSVSFAEQLDVLKSLGYEFNPKTTLKDFESELIKNGIVDTTITTMEEYFTEKPYSELYFYMGWRMLDYKNRTSLQFSKNVLWHNLDYLGTENGYINLLKQLEAISDGELRFENIDFSIDSDGFQWIAFDVNGVAKKWKLLKVNYIDDSFVSRFVYLTEEFNTKGKFTYFDIGDESYVIDYATPEEQTKFIEKTGIQREWLTVGKHFSKPND